MSIILDLIIVAIVVFAAVTSAKKGFVRTAIELFGFILAIILSFTLSTPVSELAYDKFVGPSVVESITESIDTETDSTIDDIWEELPFYVTNSGFSDVTKEELAESIKNSTEDETIAVAEHISQTVVKPNAVKVISIFISAILVIVLSILIRILARFVNKLFTFSLIGKINTVLGGVLGVGKGIAYSVIFCVIISLIISFTKDGFLIFTYDAIESSILFKFIAGFSPFI